MRSLYLKQTSNLLIRALLILAVGFTQMVLPNTAMAQQQEDEVDSVEEIIVYARRRGESLQEYAGTATVFDAQSLRDGRVDGLEDIVSRISNAYFEERAGSDMNIFVRGAGTATNGSATRTDAGIGLYYDDAYSYIQGSRIPIVLYDMERIEIFKGPQGGMYGRNSVGGSVVMHTATPSENLDRVEGYVNAELGNYNSRKLEGAVSLPLGDEWAIRIAGYSDKTDSYYTNGLTGLEEEGDDTNGVRLRLRGKLTDNLDFVFGLEYLDEDKSPMFSVPAQYGFDHVSVSDSGSRVDRETTRFLAKVTWSSSGNYEIRSVTGYTEIDAVNASDLNNLLSHPTRGDFIGIQAFGSDAHQFTQDLVAVSTSDGAFEWLIGASYFEDGNDRTSDITSGYTNLGIADSSSSSTLGIEMTAVFADIGFAVTEKLQIGASVRLSSEKRVGTISNSVVVDPETGVPIPSDAFVFTDDYDNTSPAITIKYQFTDNFMMYAKTSTGYQSGGVNRRATSIDASVFGPSDATNYELGIRSTLFNGHLTANVTAFHMKQEDYQYQTGVRPFREFVNAGTAETDGLEIDLVIILADWLTIPISYGSLDAKLVEATDARFGVGEPLVGIPDLTYVIGADMEFTVGPGDSSIFAKINYSKTEGRYDLGAGNLNDFERLNAKLGLEFGGGYSLFLYGDNLTDDTYLITPVLGGATLISPPRTYGLGISANF